jgi:hypothetical protein
MKTAVEWLFNQLSINNMALDKGTKAHQEMEQKIFEQAKEMEKEQKGYSEEDVIKLLTQRSKHFGTNVKPFQELLLKQDLEWFEQFKQQEQ